MRRMLAFGVALVLFAACVWGYTAYVARNTKTAAATFSGLRAHYSNLRMKTDDPSRITESLNAQSMVIGGSSELATMHIDTHPINLLGKNGYDMQTMLIGTGHYQSLMHAITIGAIEQSMARRKAVLIISAQWFAPEGIDSGAFSGQFSKKMYELCMANPHLSDELKQRIARRTEALYPAKGYAWDAYLAQTGHGNPLFMMESGVDRFLAQLRFDTKMMSYKPPKDEGFLPPEKPVAGMDWAALEQSAQDAGALACTNNEFGISDAYYNEYIGEDVARFAGYNSDLDYSQSPEYDDLGLYLDVCSEAGIEPMIVLVPMNGAWEDYAGFPAARRAAYYEKVRGLCAEKGALLADFSGDEATPYFLSDVMHLGWKGWVKILEATAKFYSEP